MKRIKVIVKPSSKVNSCQPSLEKDTYIVRVTAPAKEGKANQAVIEVLSKYFSVPKSRLFIVTGLLSKEKIIMIDD